MSKYGEIVGLAELFMKIGRDTAAAEVKKTTPQSTKKEKPLDLAALIAVKRKELAEFEQAVKDLEKMNKKEEKKKEGWSVDQVAMALMLILPLNWAVLYLLLPH